MGGKPSSVKGQEAALKIQGTNVKDAHRTTSKTDVKGRNGVGSPVHARKTADPTPPSTSPPNKTRPQSQTTNPPKQQDEKGKVAVKEQAEKKKEQEDSQKQMVKANEAQRKKEEEQRKQEQEDASLEQMTAQKFKAYEAQRKKEEEQRKQEQEDASLEQMTAQKFKAYEAQRKKEEEQRKQEQEDASLEQMTAQKFKAYEAQRKKEEEQKKMAQERKSVQVATSYSSAKSKTDDKQRKKLEEQEELSIDQMSLQQYKAFESKMKKKKEEEELEAALREADEMLDMYAPPSNSQFKSEKVKSYKPGDELPVDGFSPDSGLAEDRDEISEIVPGKIYLTNYRGAERVEELQELGVKHIVCVNDQANENPDKFNYFNINTLEDQEDHDARLHFQSVKEFTEKSLASGGAVVFHCAAGISRSSTMTIAFLMAAYKMSLLKAFATCYNNRRVTWPNRSFMRQLIAYEKELQKQKLLEGNAPTITLEQWDEWSAS